MKCRVWMLFFSALTCTVCTYIHTLEFVFSDDFGERDHRRWKHISNTHIINTVSPSVRGIEHWIVIWNVLINTHLERLFERIRFSVTRIKFFVVERSQNNNAELRVFGLNNRLIMAPWALDPSAFDQSFSFVPRQEYSVLYSVASFSSSCITWSLLIKENSLFVWGR